MFLSTERAKGFVCAPFSKPSCPDSGVDFNSSERPSPSSLRNEGRCSSSFVEKFSALNGLKLFVSALFRAELKSPGPGVDFSSSERHSPSPPKSEDLFYPSFVERFSALNGRKLLVSALFFRAELKGPGLGVDFSSSERHLPSPLRSEGRCPLSFVERFSALNG
jgi:hypothetical protein